MGDAPPFVRQSLAPMPASIASTRRLQAEIMDDPGLDPAEHRSALRGLARINRLSAADRTLLRAIRRADPGGSASLLDVATGSADIPLALWRRARRRALDLDVSACDVSPQAINQAEERASHMRAPVEFFRADALHDELPPADIVTCSLFLHHLEEDDAVALLARMARAARHLLLVSDLRRDALGLMLARTVPRLITASRVVHADAVSSVQGAFTIEEMRALARRAGLAGATVEARFPARMLLEWRARR